MMARGDRRAAANITVANLSPRSLFMNEKN